MSDSTKLMIILSIVSLAFFVVFFATVDISIPKLNNSIPNYFRSEEADFGAHPVFLVLVVAAAIFIFFLNLLSSKGILKIVRYATLIIFLLIVILSIGEMYYISTGNYYFSYVFASWVGWPASIIEYFPSGEWINYWVISKTQKFLCEYAPEISSMLGLLSIFFTFTFVVLVKRRKL